MVAVVVDPDGDLDSVEQARSALLAAGVLPLLLAPHGGTLTNGQPVQRTLLTARSVEFDAVLVAGAPAPAADATPGLDAKAGAATAGAVDPRVRLLLEETYRHAKAIGAWAGKDALAAADVPVDAAGVVVGDDPADVVTRVLSLLGGHRVWERFAAASA
jgi:catalase